MLSTIVAITLVVWLVVALYLFLRYPPSWATTWRDVLEYLAWPAIIVIGIYQLFKHRK
jgi:hypothetical protein